MLEIRQTDAHARWFERLQDKRARAQILARFRRLQLGNPGDVRPVGRGVSELRIDHGPGYRVYSPIANRRWFCSPVVTRAARIATSTG